MSTGENQSSWGGRGIELRSAHGRPLELRSLQVLLLKSLRLPWFWGWLAWGPTPFCFPSFESLKSLSPLELFYNCPHPFTEFERVSIPCKPKSLRKTVQIKSCLASEMLIIWTPPPHAYPGLQSHNSSTRTLHFRNINLAGPSLTAPYMYIHHRQSVLSPHLCRPFCLKCTHFSLPCILQEDFPSLASPHCFALLFPTKPYSLNHTV